MNDKVEGNTIEGNTIEGNTIVGNKIKGNKIVGNKTVGNKIVGNKIEGNKIEGNKIEGNKQYFIKRSDKDHPKLNSPILMKYVDDTSEFGSDYLMNYISNICDNNCKITNTQKILKNNKIDVKVNKKLKKKNEITERKNKKTGKKDEITERKNEKTGKKDENAERKNELGNRKKDSIDVFVEEISNNDCFYGEDEEDCPICFEKIKFKTSLEKCGCIFCFGCIYRHLFDSEICPKCFKGKNSFFDLKEYKERENKKIIPEKIFKKDSKNLKRILKIYKISSIGDLKELKWRYNELLILMEIESFKKIIKSKEAVAWIIHRKEESMKNKKNKKYDEAIEAIRDLILKFRNIFKNIQRKP